MTKMGLFAVVESNLYFYETLLCLPMCVSREIVALRRAKKWMRLAVVLHDASFC
jgi:hypothetical protein